MGHRDETGFPDSTGVVTSPSRHPLRLHFPPDTGLRVAELRPANRTALRLMPHGLSGIDARGTRFQAQWLRRVGWRFEIAADLGDAATGLHPYGGRAAR